MENIFDSELVNREDPEYRRHPGPLRPDSRPNGAEDERGADAGPPCPAPPTRWSTRPSTPGRTPWSASPPEGLRRRRGWWGRKPYPPGKKQPHGPPAFKITDTDHPATSKQASRTPAGIAPYLKRKHPRRNPLGRDPTPLTNPYSSDGRPNSLTPLKNKPYKNEPVPPKTQEKKKKQGKKKKKRGERKKTGRKKNTQPPPGPRPHSFIPITA